MSVNTKYTFTGFGDVTEDETSSYDVETEPVVVEVKLEVHIPSEPQQVDVHISVEGDEIKSDFSTERARQMVQGIIPNYPIKMYAQDKLSDLMKKHKIQVPKLPHDRKWRDQFEMNVDFVGSVLTVEVVDERLAKLTGMDPVMATLLKWVEYLNTPYPVEDEKTSKKTEVKKKVSIIDI